MAKKNTEKSTFKPAYVIDMTKCDNAFDLKVEIAMAKQNAGLAMTDADLEAVICKIVDICNEYPNEVWIVNQCDCNCKYGKKLPWYKRFWRWLTGRK